MGGSILIMQYNLLQMVAEPCHRIAFEENIICFWKDIRVMGNYMVLSTSIIVKLSILAHCLICVYMYAIDLICDYFN